jgi:membrane-associated phospholipid phosphatase
MKTIFFSLAILSTNFCVAQQTVIDTTAHTQAPIDKVALKTCNAKSTLKALIIPTVFITYGIIAQGNNGLKQLDKSIQSSIVTNHVGYKTKVDNYLQFVPAASVFALNVLGIKGKNNLRDRTMLFALSTIISTAIVTPLKHVTNVTRPDGTSNNSFPSGHTTTAFANAEFLRMEYKDISPWYGIAGYAMAAATGTLRVYNNRHWVSDVVAGAGFGILSTKLAYWIYPTIKKKFFKNKPMNAVIIPYYQSGSGGVAFVYNFRK